MEQFKIISYKGIDITVGNFGTIIINGKKPSIYKSKDGYLVFQIKNSNGKKTTVQVHRLVAMAFVSNDDPENKVEVNHKDFNRANPKYDNLEWMTHADNVAYSKEEGHYKGKFGDRNPNYGNHKLSEFYKDNPDIALEKQSRKGATNGMSKKVKLYVDDIFIKTFDYIGELAQYILDNYNVKSNVDAIRGGLRRAYNSNRAYRNRYRYEYCD